MGSIRCHSAASIGIKLFRGTEDADPDQVIREADEAMYEDKKTTAALAG